MPSRRVVNAATRFDRPGGSLIARFGGLAGDVDRDQAFSVSSGIIHRPFHSNRHSPQRHARMHQGRRTGGRRRRVLYTSHHADSSTPTAASRREAAKLRKARRPPAAYGWRVHRRLRGRWFSLVPVRRRTLTITSTVIVSITLLLCLAHYFAVTWSALAYRPEVARPLRLDRPDSFGHWIMCVWLAGCSAASLLIYQLRRYRNDDYRGQYRLWRLVLVLLLIASVHSLVGLIDWGGALLDAVLGQRVALNGNDWLRLLVGIGSAIIGLRLIAEVRQSRWSLIWLSTACAFFAIPEAVNWNVMTVETIGRWTLVTSAPLIACTAMFLALLGYLRMLLREVRRIEDDSLLERFQELKTRLLARRRDDTEDTDEQEDRPRRRWFAFGSPTARTAELDDDQEDEADEYEQDEDEYDDGEYEDEDEQADEENEYAEDEPLDEEPDLTPRKKRRWFGLRAAQPEVSEGQASDQPEEEPAPEQQRKKRRWSLRLNPVKRSADDEDQPEDSPQAEDNETAEQPKRRFGLSWRRKPTSEDDEAASEPADSGYQSDDASSASSGEADDDYIDPDEIDWDRLSKAERRRLRKQLKRQGRAA